ncbi:MAG: CoA transferase [Ruminococcaceae bacterium]|nr:CoA transferase [Oscillospiraceae bacterium]
MKPLEGIKVVELATYLAAPSCARTMADWGADVIKIEPPQGDIYRIMGVAQRVPNIGDNNPVYDNENVNKKFIALNLKDPAGTEVLMKLLEDADVFVTNTRPKALKKLGLSYEDLKDRFPRLIHASVLGYGEKGPDKDRPAFDYTTFYARTGMMADLPQKNQDVMNTIPGLGDHVVGSILLSGICAALYARTITGKGDCVDAGLYQAGIYAMSNGMLMANFGREMPRTRYELNNPISNTYKCKDGEWVYLAATAYDKQWPLLCEKVFKRQDLLDNPEYATIAKVTKHAPDVAHILDDIFATEDSTYWLDLFAEYDIPHERVAHYKDIAHDEQAWANNYIREETYPTGEKVVFTNTPVNFASITEEAPFKLAPVTGGNTREVLAAAGYSNEEIDKLAESGAIKVVDK